MACYTVHTNAYKHAHFPVQRLNVHVSMNSVIPKNKGKYCADGTQQEVKYYSKFKGSFEFTDPFC